MVPGRVYWVGTRVGNTGVYYPATLLALRSRRQTATARERALPAGEGGLEAGGTDPFANMARNVRPVPVPPLPAVGPGPCRPCTGTGLLGQKGEIP